MKKKKEKFKTSTYLSESRSFYSYQSQKGTLLQVTYVKPPEQAFYITLKTKYHLKRVRSRRHRFREQKSDIQSQLLLHLSCDNAHISRSLSPALSQSKVNTCPTGFLLENPQQTHSSHCNELGMPISMIKNNKDRQKTLHLVHVSSLKTNFSLHKTRSITKTPAHPQRCQK